MSKLYAWSNQIKTEIDSKKDLLYTKDYSFFKIDRLERMAQRIDEFSDQCNECMQFKPEIESLSRTFVDSVNGSSSDKLEFEKRNESIVNHLKKKHHLVQKNYYVALYSFIGFLSGSVFLGLIFYIFNKEYLTLGLFVGFAAGMITGRIYGRKKDRFKISRNEIL